MTTVRGAADLARNLARLSADLGRSRQSLMVQQARAICVAMGAVTEPGGMSGETPVAVRKTVANEIHRVFASASNKHAVAAVIHRRSETLANAYLRAMSEGKIRQAARYMREAGISPEAVDIAAHKAARTGKNAHVPKGTTPSSVARSPQLAAYVRKKSMLVGAAKAGWYAAAKALGGRIRSNDTINGKRVTAEIFPDYVRTIARQIPGLGGAMVSADRVEVWTSVRYARNALPSAKQSHALELGRESFANAVRKSAAALVRKHFRSAA